MSRVLLDVTHTSHSEANTGIQRVVRKLAAHWPTGEGTEQSILQSVVFDTYANAWRCLDSKEADNVAFGKQRKPGVKRGSSWSCWQRARGRLSRRGLPMVRFPEHGVQAVICAELSLDKRRFNAIARLRGDVGVVGPLIAVFHDMIAVDMPQFTPVATVQKYHDYLEHLLQFDIIAANSAHSRDRLITYWAEKNIKQTPVVIAVPLGVDAIVASKPIPANGADNQSVPLVLSVGSLEARKNHISLLNACEQLWTRGLQFRLRLIGMLNKETGGAAAVKISALKDAGRTLEWFPNADDQTLFNSYKECAFTVYPSLYEGFGLPVLESVAHGRPCVCSGLTAMAEIVGEGGVVAAGEPTVENITVCMEMLLTDKRKIAVLSREALARKIRSWDDYASDMLNLAKGSLP